MAGSCLTSSGMKRVLAPNRMARAPGDTATLPPTGGRPTQPLCSFLTRRRRYERSDRETWCRRRQSRSDQIFAEAWRNWLLRD